MDWENRRGNKMGLLQEAINSEDINVDRSGLLCLISFPSGTERYNIYSMF